MLQGLVFNRPWEKWEKGRSETLAWTGDRHSRVSLGSRTFGRSKHWFSLPQEAELERLEREFAIQSQITEAARRLASDPNVSKKLKKQRKTSYLNALKKLQEIENAINENRIKSGKKPTQRASLVIDGQCHPQAPALLHDSQVLLGSKSEPCRIQVASHPCSLLSIHKREWVPRCSILIINVGAQMNIHRTLFSDVTMNYGGYCASPA